MSKGKKIYLEKALTFVPEGTAKSTIFGTDSGGQYMIVFEQEPKAKEWQNYRFDELFARHYDCPFFPQIDVIHESMSERLIWFFCYGSMKGFRNDETGYSFLHNDPECLLPNLSFL